MLLHFRSLVSITRRRVDGRNRKRRVPGSFTARKVAALHHAAGCHDAAPMNLDASRKFINFPLLVPYHSSLIPRYCGRSPLIATDKFSTLQSAQDPVIAVYLSVSFCLTRSHSNQVDSFRRDFFYLHLKINRSLSNFALIAPVAPLRCFGTISSASKEM